MFAREPRRPGCRRNRVAASEIDPQRQDRRRHLGHAGRVQGHPGRARTARRSSLPTSARAWTAGRPPAASGRSATASLCQVGAGEGVRALAGDAKWTDYTLTLKARKTRRRRRLPHPLQQQERQEKYWWNLGGWGNTRHGLEGAGLPTPRVPGKIETGRWYDIKVEIKGPRIECYLDQKLIHDVVRRDFPSLFAVAGQGGHDDTVIVKVGECGPGGLGYADLAPRPVHVEPNAEAIVLAGNGPDDENSFEGPASVAPKRESVKDVAPGVPAYLSGLLRYYISHSSCKAAAGKTLGNTTHGSQDSRNLVCYREVSIFTARRPCKFAENSRCVVEGLNASGSCRSASSSRPWSATPQQDPRCLPRGQRGGQLRRPGAVDAHLLARQDVDRRPDRACKSRSPTCTRSSIAICPGRPSTWTS